MIIAGWFGFGGNSWQAEQFRDELAEHGIALKVCSEYPNADVKYDRNTIKNFIDSCNICIFPTREKVQPAKSSNRLLLAMSRGKPCVVGPLDSYLRVGKDGEHFVVATKENFVQKVVELSKNRPLMQRMGQNAFQRVMMLEDGFHPINMAKKLMFRINEAVKEPGLPSVHVIIPHYLPRSDYLNLAVKSVLNSRAVNVKISVVSSSCIQPSIVEHPTIRLHWQKERMTFSQANNYALKNHVSSDTEYVLLLNDDAFVSEWTIARMVASSKNLNDEVILNPFSNCDRGWLHNSNLEIGGKQLVPAMKIEEFTEGEIQILLKSQFSDDPTFFESPFAAFYSTLIPRKVLDSVGVLNEQFINGGEDADYCFRAKALGFKVGWVRSAFTFHFGGKSRKESHETRKNEHEADDKYTNERLTKRWPRNKKRVCIYTGQAWVQWSINTPYETGIGGSEYVEGQLAKAYAEAGHHVVMYGDHPTVEQYGVELRDWRTFKPEEEYFDLFISSRNIYPIERVKAKKIVVHVHDIWLMSGQEIRRDLYDKVNHFICLSPWHVEFFSKHHGIPKDKIIIIPNGMDTSMLKFDPDMKEYGRLHYSSSPDRGLDNILYLLPWIKEKIPELKLFVGYGFSNWMKAAESRNDEYTKSLIDRIKTDLDKCKDYVEFAGLVNLPKLHDMWNRAYTWMYPTNFTETSCLTAMEAMYSGTPIVCSNLAALQTTVGKNGRLVDYYPADSREARTEYLEEVIKLHKDKDYWIQRSRQALEGAKHCDWNHVYNNYWAKLL
jgi:glycosyltransferase involved in cell wall biosynthesis